MKNLNNYLLHNFKTNWDNFRIYLDEFFDLKIPLKSEEDIDKAVDNLNLFLQKAVLKATPKINTFENHFKYSDSLKKALAIKRKYRKIWQITHCPDEFVVA